MTNNERSLPSSEPAGMRPPPVERFPAKPVRLPGPTFWPFFMAVGLSFIGWGLIATWLIATGGAIVFVISLVGWINDMRHE